MGDPISTENEKSIYTKVIHLVHVPATLSDVPLDAATAVGNEGMHTCNENRKINGTVTTEQDDGEDEGVGEENHHRHQSLNLMMISCEDSYPYGPSSNTAVSVLQCSYNGKIDDTESVRV